MDRIRGGYILQPRCFDRSDTSKFPPVTRELWMYLLRRVNHKEAKGYQRGQGFFNLGDIQKDLSWFIGYRREMYSKPQLTKSLRRLCDASMVETMKATRGVIITICNYSFYQDPQNYEGNNEGSTKETGRERESHTKNKNVKNEEERKENTKAPARQKKPVIIISSLDIISLGVSEVVANDFIFFRKSKKAPLTQTAWDGLTKEFQEAGLTIESGLKKMIERNWIGFEAKWLINKSFGKGNNGNGNTEERDARLQKLFAENEGIGDTFQH